ncbi:hypothetical protein ALI144C_39315 [Actinosynnema sp. ALI-1.44]|uniref:hypothetical protein n=1 Tax=Actinosynnema sp. ALI-1.44 TaxID=1933779 RepID=UPI00097BB3F6|nr:hypothetical protein [Actinosynnema sp. ALI-1.44]ONI74844.1 hypothetical protein ALI144C_39315 [Actinosynnema sp. ALI-1.44]
MARVVGLGLFSAVLFGVMMAFFDDNLWVAVVGGVFFGVGMAVFMRPGWEPRPLKGLDRVQRRHVTRTMRSGEAMDDPELARPLTELVDATLAIPFSPTLMRVAAGLMFALGGTSTVLAIVARGEVSLLGGPLLVLMSLALAFVFVPTAARQRERAAQAKRATQSRWGENPTG